MWTEADRKTYAADGGRYPSDLTDAEWATIAPLLSVYDPLTADLRAMVDACLYLDKTGCPWRYLPRDFGAWETVRTWHDRFRGDGIWSEIAGLLTRAVRRERGRQPEPSTAILDSQSVTSGPQAGPRGYDGNKKTKGIKRHVLTCSLGFVLASLVTAANVHDTQAAGLLFDRAARNGWAPERVKVDGIYVGARMEQAAEPPGLDIQVSTRERDAEGFKPLPLRWRIVLRQAQDEGDLRDAHQSLATPDPQSGADARSCRGCHRHRKLPPPPQSLSPTTIPYHVVKQALRRTTTNGCSQPIAEGREVRFPALSSDDRSRSPPLV